MGAMVVLASCREMMGRFIERLPLMTFGWAATEVMVLASTAMLISQFT
ncbi:MAG TPA: hypothetical protein VLM36_01360 [Sphingomicrobium sp.]|nr:hypothetical protein [Sphingomicrobium sp.]